MVSDRLREDNKASLDDTKSWGLACLTELFLSMIDVVDNGLKFSHFPGYDTKLSQKTVLRLVVLCNK